MKVAAIVLALASAGCLRGTTYKCASNDQCSGTGGVCEDVGFCSFADSNCNGGRRYGEFSGVYANKCVGDVLPIDAGPDDVVPIDVPGDVAVGNCPASYSGIAGQAHRYRVISNQAVYATHEAACAADGSTSYLAVPNDQTELTAILAAAAANVWVGINDAPPGTEGTYVTSNGGTFSATDPLWDSGEPDDAPESGTGNNNSDCAAAFMNNAKLSDDKCSNTFPAVCECEP